MFARERKQATLQELALTDLLNREILSQKALAALWSARLHVLWVGIHWTIDLVVGGLHPVAILTWPVFAVYAVFAAWLGMFFAVRESPQLKAGPMSTLMLLGMAGLPWLMPFGYMLWWGGQHVEDFAFLAAGLSPPAVLGFLTRGWSHEPLDERRAWLFWIAFVAGMTGLMMLTAALRRGAIRRFGRDRLE